MKKRVILFISVILCVTFSSYSQTFNDAVKVYNDAGALFSEGKYSEALIAYEQSVKISAQVGDSALDLQLKSEQRIPKTYFNIGKAFYEAKNLNDAIPNFEKAIETGIKINDEKTAEDSKSYLAGIYYSLGTSDFKNKAYDNALENYNKILLYKPEYYKAYYGIGIVYGKQENLPLMKENLDKAIAMAGDDAKTIGNAKDAATSAYQKAGALFLQASKYNDAVTNLLASQEYNNTEPRTYFYLAIAYNGLSKWDDAIIAANKALELQTEDKSDIFFELAKALESKGDKASACANYKNVTGGNNAEAAKYQIEQVLKCQ